MEIIAYEMKYTDACAPKSDIACIPFDAEFFQEYKRIYNECFYEMRKALDIQPYHFLSAYDQIADKVQDIYLLVDQGEIIGSVACYGNEIDDLIVNHQFQHVLATLNGMENSMEKLWLSVLIFTGMRRGEALGLMWEDIDFENKVIHIRRSVTHPGNPAVIGKTKTGNGVRVVGMGDYLESLVTPMKSSGFLFGGERPLSRKQFLLMIERLNKAVNLHGATPHVLRHTYLTYMATMNTDMKTLQAIAGHGDIQTTMNICVHETSENVKAACFEMDTMLHNLATTANIMQ